MQLVQQFACWSSHRSSPAIRLVLNGPSAQYKHQAGPVWCAGGGRPRTAPVLCLLHPPLFLPHQLASPVDITASGNGAQTENLNAKRAVLPFIMLSILWLPPRHSSARELAVTPVLTVLITIAAHCADTAPSRGVSHRALSCLSCSGRLDGEPACPCPLSSLRPEAAARHRDAATRTSSQTVYGVQCTTVQCTPYTG